VLSRSGAERGGSCVSSGLGSAGLIAVARSRLPACKVLSSVPGSACGALSTQTRRMRGRSWKLETAARPKTPKDNAAFHVSRRQHWGKYPNGFFESIAKKESGRAGCGEMKAAPVNMSRRGRGAGFEKR
jgi:hypothetical protein